jgi:cytochrome c biogenesis protein CcdA
VFAVYLTGGLVLVFGPGRMLIAWLHHLRGPLEHTLEASIGVLALAFALFLWRSRGNADDRPTPRRAHTRASAFALGAGIMAVELPTAFMYFGAVSAILAAHRAAPIEISLLATYNALFVAPLLAFLAIRHLAGERAQRWMADAEARIRHLGHLIVTGVVLAGGLALLTIGIDGLLLS